MRRLGYVGLRRGVFGGSRAWFVVWLTLMVAKLLWRASTRTRESVWSAEVAPGESLVITHLPETRAEVRRRG